MAGVMDVKREAVAERSGSVRDKGVIVYLRTMNPWIEAAPGKPLPTSSFACPARHRARSFTGPPGMREFQRLRRPGAKRRLRAGIGANRARCVDRQGDVETGPPGRLLASR